jgi:HSP20 family protein
MALFDFQGPRPEGIGSDGPWSAFDQLRRELGDVLGAFSPEGSRVPRSQAFPPVNLYETADAWVLMAELPGLRAQDIDVCVEGDCVTLRGERRIEVPDAPGVSIHRRERQAGIFRRSVQLPHAPEADEVEAAYRGGVLQVRLPKPPSSKPRQITIHPS